MEGQPTPPPIVRYHILCEVVRTDEGRPGRLCIDGLLSSIQSLEKPSYPFLYEELCILLLVTAGRGSGVAHVRCIYEETGETVFRTPDREIRFGADPLSVSGITYRIRDCVFPLAGHYVMEWWYNGIRISEQYLLME